MIKHQELLRVLHYDPETGNFTRKTTHKIVGTKLNTGYIRIGLFRSYFPAHKLAWFYINGVWPKGEIHHKNWVPWDNRLCNLQEVTRSQNQRATRNYSRKICLPKGVRIKNNKWQARIRIDKKLKSLGVFDCPAAANLFYQIATEVELRRT